MRERVLKWPVPGRVDAEAAFATLCGNQPRAFWLDSSGEPVGGGARSSYLGVARSAVTSVDLAAQGVGVLDWIRRERASWDVDASTVPRGFALGLVGWLGYELRTETLGVPARHARRYPDAAFLRADRCLAIDDTTGEATLLARGVDWDGELAEWRDATLDALATPTRLAPAPPPGDVPSAAWRYSDEAYLGMIRACKAAIEDGDAYQLCLTTEASVDGAFDPFDVYRRLRASSPSHHGAYLRIDDVALLSASPEQFLALDRDGWVTTKPIKGTRPRAADPVEDARLREELRSSDKERAENLMIVDLMRNDLSRVCELGTVEVSSLLAVESYPHVHQLVSTIRGRLAAGLDAVDAIRACFPAGSMTGAPKRSAIEILDRLEGRSRGVYSGAFGYLGLDGAVDLAMTIRSIVIDDRGATIGTGGGITALSDPDEELEETRVKARALLAALGVG